MKYINSIRLYYYQNKKDKIILSIFFSLIYIMYFLPFWGYLVFEKEVVWFLNDLFHLDILLTAPMTFIYIFIYLNIFDISNKVSFIYILTYVLGMFLTLIAVGMSGGNLLIVLPQLILILFVPFVFKFIENNELKNKIYHLSRAFIYLNMLIPLILINILGRLYFYLFG